MRRRRVARLALTLAVVGMLGFAVTRPATVPGSHDLYGFGHERGSPDARVVVVQFVDFSCPACGNFARVTLPRIEQEWIATGRAHLRVIPFNALGSGWTAARAAECAGEQDAFWPMHDRLFAQQQEWLGKLGRRGQYLEFTRWAVEMKLDTARFHACWKGRSWAEQVERNTRLARRNAIPGTPAFVVNGRALVGDLPYAEFSKVFEQASAGQPDSSGGLIRR